MAPRSRILTASGERLFRQARSCRPPVFIAKHHSTKWRQFDWVRQGTRPLIGSFGAVRLKGEIAVDGVQALNQADPANDSRRPQAVSQLVRILQPNRSFSPCFDGRHCGDNFDDSRSGNEFVALTSLWLLLCVTFLTHEEHHPNGFLHAKFGTVP